MRDDKLRKALDEMSGNSPLFLDNPAYDGSIIGLSNTGAIIYSYDGMVEELAHDEQISASEAIEFIDANTICALSFACPTPPIIMYNIISAEGEAEVDTDDRNISEEI